MDSLYIIFLLQSFPLLCRARNSCFALLIFFIFIFVYCQYKYINIRSVWTYIDICFVIFSADLHYQGKSHALVLETICRQTDMTFSLCPHLIHFVQRILNKSTVIVAMVWDSIRKILDYEIMNLISMKLYVWLGKIIGY